MLYLVVLFAHYYKVDLLCFHLTAKKNTFS
jgi:hypothetical protein